jgi:pyruvate dehydrogenase E2 component (dihydrolipoamide acetyltransferase)
VSANLKGEVTEIEPSLAERAVIRRAAESRATVPVLELSLPARQPAASTAQLVHACALALRQHPRANAAYRDGRFELYSRVNVGVLVAAQDIYTIPTVLDADRKTPDELAQEIAELAAQALGGTLPAPALSGATFTVWNAAPAGIAAASLPVVSPQAATLTAGTRDLVLACDHRILYGAGAVGFLQALAHHLDGSGV